MTTKYAPALRRDWRSELLELAPGALLAGLMIWCVVRSLVIANWAAGLEVLVPVTMLAFATGLVFARLLWLPAWFAHLLSATLGLVFIIQRLGTLMGERLTTWPDQATELLIRTIIWARVLANGGRGEDILLFVAAVSLLGWLLGYCTAWMIFRQGWVWRPVLLNAVVILVNYAYVMPKPTALFFVFLGAGLLLIVYQQVVINQRRWTAAQIEFPELLPLRFVSAAAVCFGLTWVITGLLPGEVSRNRAEDTWSTLRQPFKIARERWEDAFSTINAQPGASGTSFTSRATQLGGGRILDDDVVMYVDTPRFEYWRAVAFDRYSNDGWQNTTGERARAALGLTTAEQARSTLAGGAVMPLADLRARSVMTQTVRLAQDRKDNFITVAGTAASVSLPVAVEHSFRGPERPNFDDTALIVSQEPLRANDVYTVTALVSNADILSLRRAGTDYPAWVRDRYLQLPDTVTERTLNQAREIVEQFNASNPYDQAVAIQTYLRTLPYNERIDAPPPGVEPVDYFLFELRQGYCDYYASAMVVMLRSLGVPARWVQGYAGGVYDPDLERYVVRENIAHSWPEVYFPGFGWERFEPTPASYTAEPVRPNVPVDGDIGDRNAPSANVEINEPLFTEEELLEEGLLPDSSAGIGLDETLEENTGLDMRTPLAVLAVIGGSLGLFVMGGIVFWRRETRDLSPAAQAYAEMSLLAQFAGLPQYPHSTAREYGNDLVYEMPYYRASIERIVNAYVGERYRSLNSGGDLTTDLRELRWPFIQRMLRRLGAGETAADRRARRRRR
jgi:transglutaminase-like putative cysteine protease